MKHQGLWGVTMQRYKFFIIFVVLLREFYMNY